MPHKSVRYRKQLEAGGSKREPVSIEEGIKRVQKLASVKSDRSYKNGKKRKGFDQTVELVLHLGINPKQADQMVRGALSLPKGTGRARRVIAFCEDADADAARSAGAIEAGAEELIAKIREGWMDFDVAIAHPRMMSKVGKLGRVLGPQGKMPSPKAGTVTAEVETAVREFTAGKVEYRNDAGGNIHLPVGKVSFPLEDLQLNIDTVVSHIQKVRPASVKGQFIKRACLSATSTPSVGLAIG